MLKKIIQGGTRDWHHWLPFLLFAVQKVPLLKCYMDDTLDVVRKEWEEGALDLPLSPSTYVMALRERFKQVVSLAKEELEAYQVAKKRQCNTIHQSKGGTSRTASFTGDRKYKHVTPILHWLPVSFHAQFKMLV